MCKDFQKSVTLTFLHFVRVRASNQPNVKCILWTNVKNLTLYVYACLLLIQYTRVNVMFINFGREMTKINLALGGGRQLDWYGTNPQ